MSGTPSPPGSVSRMEFTAEVRGKGSSTLALYRHLAPLTVNAVARSMPLDSRVSVQPAMVCLFTNIRTGVEKQRLRFERGDVSFLASGELICIFLKPAVSARPLNPIGKVERGIEVFDRVKPGDVVSLRQVSP